MVAAEFCGTVNHHDGIYVVVYNRGWYLCIPICRTVRLGFLW